MSSLVIPQRTALDAVLRPSSVAVIGASRDAAKRGHHIVRALLESGYTGRVIPINPSGGDLLGLRVARAIAEVKPPPELAVVCTPARTVPAILEDCAAAGVGGAVILAVGFGESGEEGLRLEAEVAAIARRTGIRVVGPNTSGLINVSLGLNLIGLRDVPAGRLALLVQSGNLALQLITECGARSGAGFAYVVGAGNETDVRFHEYLRDLAADDDTDAILVHTEGFRDGRAFIDVAREVAAAKPIVLLKGARTEAGGAAAKSHTGALAGEYAVLRAALRHAGVIEVTRTDELLHVGETLASQPPLAAGRGIVVLSDGGGHGALAVDTLTASGAPLAEPGAGTKAALRVLLGPAAAVGNPVDLAGAADGEPQRFAQTLALLTGDPAVGAILVVGLFGGYARRFSDSLLPGELDAAESMPELARAAGVALIVHSLYAATRSAPLRALTNARVPVVESLEVACRCATALAERRAGLERVARSGRASPPPSVAPPIPPYSVVEGRRVLLEPEARAVAASFGVPLARAEFCAMKEEAIEAAARMTGPYALKAVAPAALHKTDAGGVALRVERDDVGAAFDRIVASVQRHARDRGLSEDVRGILLGPMAPTPVAELFAGVRSDPQFGPVLAVGAGGIFVEVLQDVSLRVLPVDDADVREMIDELRIGPVLRGIRGNPAADIAALTRLIRALGECALAHPSIDTIELNPIFAYAEGALVLDARAVLGDG